MTEKTIRVATDVGGTFTDLVAFELDAVSGAQRIRTAKSDTTPPAFERGVINVVAEAGISVEEIAVLTHGTTVIINALTERKGVRTALLTTAGFRDTLEIARGNRPDFFNLHYVKPKPFVPRYLRQELPGRMDYRGRELHPLDLAELPALIAMFKAEGVAAIAICLLHSYVNPAHEIALMAAVKALWPEVSVVASHQITREWREYERTNTTVLSAYVQPIAVSYLERLESGLASQGFGGQLYVMQSNCGVDSLKATKQIPITMVESGPASGFWGAAELGKLIGAPNILALDIGGTTAKCSLIEDGQVRIRTDYWIERDGSSAGYPIMVPVVDLVEIGNGGGSIAWVDDFGKLHVGPQSAGASPGPAAYGRGGAHATTTDANLALARIGVEDFCGGTLTADMAAANAALEKVAVSLGVTAEEAARGIIRVANNNMVNALKLVSLNRGYDPRDFTLVAFGGGGAMHASALAAELGMRKVVIPRQAAVFSAWGMMMSDLRRDYFATRLIEDGPETQTELAGVIAEIADAARTQFGVEGFTGISVRTLVKCRYRNQEHSVEVPVAETPDRASYEAMLAQFHVVYEKEYTYRLSAPVEIVGVHLIATASIDKLEMVAMAEGEADATPALKSRRDVDFALEGKLLSDIYDSGKLLPGMTFAGPAIVEDPGMTLVVHPLDHVRIDCYGNYHVEIGTS